MFLPHKTGYYQKPRLIRNRKSNAWKSEFSAFDYLCYSIIAYVFSQYCRISILQDIFCSLNMKQEITEARNIGCFRSAFLLY